MRPEEGAICNHMNLDSAAPTHLLSHSIPHISTIPVVVVMLGPEPLPRTPQCYTDWKEADPEYSRAYDLVLEAQQYAQAEDNDKIVPTRVVGYLLIELFDRRQTLTMAPYRCVVKEISSVSGEGHFDPIFEVGKRYRDRFLRPLCAFLPLLSRSVS